LTPSIQERATRPIVVVFGGGSSDTALLRVLGSLVSKPGTNIAGVFLEDQTLFRLAELPFITELSRFSTTRRRLVVHDLERELKVQARRAERELQRLAESLGHPWSFRTHRGPLRTAIAEAHEVDLLLLGATRQALVGELSSIARSERHSGIDAPQPIGVLLEEAETGRRALEHAIELATKTGRPLIVFLSEESARAHRDLGARLRPLGPGHVAIHRVRDAGLEALAAAVRRASPAVLIAAAGEEGFEERRIGMLRLALRCPVVVVRERSD
jgi:nucleotide-binding universal stress UspA family protein